MKYFHGFSLQNEEHFFDSYIDNNDYTVAGFSYGAQQALEYTYVSKERIDKLILLSPAFFQTHKKSFIRTQLRYFEADKESYIDQFLSNVSYPSTVNLSTCLKAGTQDELSALLNFIWDENKIQEIKDRGTIIEVFIAQEDKILDAQETISFFKKNCTVYSIKKSGHLLQER